MRRRRVLLGNFRYPRALALYMPAAVLMFLIVVSPLYAQFLVTPVNLAYLAQRADIIILGRVVDVVYEGLPGYTNIPTVKVTINVENMMRGPQRDTYTFREVSVGLRARMGNQVYGKGQQLLLFLTAPSKYGLSSPIGIEQGRFHITSDSRGNQMVVNEQSNIGLFRNVAVAASMAGRPLTASQLKITISERGPVQLTDFLSVVQNLMLLPRIR